MSAKRVGYLHKFISFPLPLFAFFTANYAFLIFPSKRFDLLTFLESSSALSKADLESDPFWGKIINFPGNVFFLYQITQAPPIFPFETCCFLHFIFEILPFKCKFLPGYRSVTLCAVGIYFFSWVQNRHTSPSKIRYFCSFWELIFFLEIFQILALFWSSGNFSRSYFFVFVLF